MKRSHKTILALALVLTVALAVGTGLAMAQTDDSTTGDSGSAQGAWGPGDCESGGLGGPGHFGRPGLMVGGDVVSVEGDIINLSTPSGSEKQVQVDANTSYRKDGAEASLSDVVAGERIGVALTEQPEEGETPLAKTVIIGAPDRPHMQRSVGDVTAVDGNNVTINTADGERQFTLPQIQVGSRLGVAEDGDGNVKGLMYDPPDWSQGSPAAEESQTSDSTGSAS